MKNLIKYYTYLILKSKLFLMCIIFTEILIFSLNIPMLLLHPETHIEGNFDTYAMIGFISAFVAICSYTTGTLFSQKFIGDTVSTGFSRRQVYLAKTIVNAAFCFILLILNLLTFFLTVVFLKSEANFIIFENFPTKLIMIFFMSLFYIVLCTSLSFIAKTPIGGVICAFFVGVVGTNVIVTALTFLLNLLNGFNFLFFFNNYFFRYTFYLDDINNYVFSVSGIYLILTAVFYFLGERNFRKADLK